MPVFISYQTADRYTAGQIRDSLGNWGISTYLDVMDPALKSDEDVTQVILRRLEECTHLMAVVSENTINSWWVPFEIGVATKDQRRIASYRRDLVTLPDFLKIWPVLDYPRHLRDFARRYFEDNVHTARNDREFLSESLFKTIRTADSFHRNLKSDLGQS